MINYRKLIDNISQGIVRVKLNPKMHRGGGKVLGKILPGDDKLFLDSLLEAIKKAA